MVLVINDVFIDFDFYGSPVVCNLKAEIKRMLDLSIVQMYGKRLNNQTVKLAFYKLWTKRYIDDGL